MKRLVSCIYAPVFLFGFIGCGFWQPHALILLFVIAVAVSFLAEQWLPYEPQWNCSLGDRRRDTVHALVNESLNALGLLILPGLTALFAFEGLWPRGWPLWQQLLMAIVLGIPLDVAQLLALAIALQLLLQHSNVDMRLGPLRWVFAWAPVHRFHHMKYGHAGDVNFGLFFNLWDWLLGTAFYREGYRMGAGDLGIGSRPDFPVGYGAQLRDPFRPVALSKEPSLPDELR
ncbi:sterol desaturase family protein [Pseudomonas extremorientalis]|jgi:sterol desaturase/sphingolipid hydroxylase (fatty acid hydroxylase superfamily)|uniref:sterol desaturase family protein n=1 Tax=Pseudomonas extremorientalis TaxID=169669 RepID=UPI002732DA58|nr:sterol desaturase family protein [Pseudomonas extremorientalis]WLG55639.1 sterol desaturase family protein [Pseudomonas extremorientalis]